MMHSTTSRIFRLRTLLYWTIGLLLIAAAGSAIADHVPPGILVIHFRSPPDYMDRPAGSGPYTQYDIQSALQLAKLGDAEAQSNLGIMLASRGDFEKAAYWEKQAADAGLATAAYNLGTMYFNGQGFKQDYAQAHQWFVQSAKRGNRYAEFQLGITYFTGQGVEKDPVQESHWYEKAARQGVPAAQYNLAVNYFNGEGVPQDRGTAYAWMLLAQKGGMDASDALTAIARDMTPSQIQSAVKLSHSLSSDSWQAMRK